MADRAWQEQRVRHIASIYHITEIEARRKIAKEDAEDEVFRRKRDAEADAYWRSRGVRW